ncbi:MAG: hypothetical protein Q7J29_15590 [Stagnimonas sp.]|nr:hypothetical protein [Stagnimonas sp.]
MSDDPSDLAASTAITALRAWEQDVDPVQRARLAAARRRALDAASPTRAWPLWDGLALAASLTLAIGLGRSPAPAGTPPDAAAQVIELSDDNPELLPEGLDGDLELYLWLDGSEA